MNSIFALVLPVGAVEEGLPPLVVEAADALQDEGLRAVQHESTM